MDMWSAGRRQPPKSGVDGGFMIRPLYGVILVSCPSPTRGLPSLWPSMSPAGVLRGEVAAPVFKQSPSQILWYLRIPPSAGRSPASSLTSSPTGSGTR